MTTVQSHAHQASTAPPVHVWDKILEWLRLLAVVWLLLVGLWSGPALGASLVYPNGLLQVEAGLAVVLVLLALRGRVRPLRDYPFLWPCLAMLALCAVAATMRVEVRGTAPAAEALRLWKDGEPMARGLLLYLALAGQPRLLRVAWVALLCGLALQVAAAILQHLMHVSRFYANLDAGWAGGWAPVTEWNTPAVNVLQPAPRVQGLTSYINLTAAMLAASLPFWALPPIFRIPNSRWVRVALGGGALLTAVALWYTNSRGPLLAVILVAALIFFRLAVRWRWSFLGTLGALLLAVVPARPRWSVAAFVAAIGLAFFTRRHRLACYFLPVIFALGLAGGLQILRCLCDALPIKLAHQRTRSG